MEIRNFSEFLLEKKKTTTSKKIGDMSKQEIKSLKVGDSVIDGNGEIEAHGFKIVVDGGKVKSKENIGDEVDPKDPKIWKPGSGPWFLEYISQIKSENDQIRLVNLTEKDIIKLGEEFTKIDSSMKWEKVYQFAKYCLTGKEEDYLLAFRDQKKDKKKVDGLITNILNLEVEGKTIEKIFKKGVDNSDLGSYTSSIYSAIKIYITKTLTEEDSKKYFGEKIPSDFNDFSVISLLASLYQPRQGDIGKPIFTTDKTLPIFKKSEGWNEAKEKEETDKENLWPDSWTIPIDPTRVEDLIRNAEMCVRCSLSCIKEISLLMSETAQEDAKSKIEELEKKLKDINALREGGENSEKEDIKDYILGKEDEADGSETGKIYTFWRDNFDEKNKIKDPSKITGEKSGLTVKMNKDFIENFEKAKLKIEEARALVDEGKISKAEFFSNVEAYSEDEERKSVEVGEGLKKVMYEEVKEAIGDLQSAIDNYTSGSGEKNALDQYLKVYKEFINKAKDKYVVEGSGDKKTIKEKP